MPQNFYSDSEPIKRQHMYGILPYIYDSQKHPKDQSYRHDKCEPTLYAAVHYSPAVTLIEKQWIQNNACPTSTHM
jgi:hypothetical protein